MKKVFKKSILILLGFILGSVVCISIGVYAYSYAATDIQYSGTTSVKQAVDDLYTKASLVEKVNSGLVLVEESSTGFPVDKCNEAKEGCICYYIYNYTDSNWNPSGTFSYKHRGNCQIKDVKFRGLYGASIYDPLTTKTIQKSEVGFSDTVWNKGIVGLSCIALIECNNFIQTA